MELLPTPCDCLLVRLASRRPCVARCRLCCVKDAGNIAPGAEGEIPAPMIAGIAHYQFATIHRYYDGNGRTARLLTNFILHLSGYGLNGIYSLEEYYARNLQDYYQAISAGESHNYYESNRAEADISHWIEYFIQGMADSFARVRVLAEKLRTIPDQSNLLRELDRARVALVKRIDKIRRCMTPRTMGAFLRNR